MKYNILELIITNQSCFNNIIVNTIHNDNINKVSQLQSSLPLSLFSLNCNELISGSIDEYEIKFYSFNLESQYNIIFDTCIDGIGGNLSSMSFDVQ